MNDRYMVISPDTLEAMRRAGHAAKLEARIENLEAELHSCFHRIEELQAALREIAALGYWDGDSAMNIARKALEGEK